MCIPNDAAVTGEPGLYSVFDVETTRVMDAFATYPGLRWPGQLGQDAQGQPVLLDCWCGAQCSCCCTDGSPRNACGLCGATLPCACSCEARDRGECVQCPPPATEPDAVRVCVPLGSGFFRPVDVARCSVAQLLAVTPGAQWPGHAGLDCDCVGRTTTTTTTAAPTTPPALDACLVVYPTCAPTPPPLTQQGVCLPLPNSSLSAFVTCTAGGQALSAWACPFGCSGVCTLDPALATLLGLDRFAGPQLLTGVCAALPGLPDPWLQCVPGTCPQVTTLPLTTPASTTTPAAATTTTSAVTTAVSTTSGSAPVTTTTAAPTTPPVRPPACLSVVPLCAPGGADVASGGVLCSVGDWNGLTLGFRLGCDDSGLVTVHGCSPASTTCGPPASTCMPQPLWAELLGLAGVNASSGVCVRTNLPVPGLGVDTVGLTCAPCPTTAPPTTTTTAPPTTPPVLVPPPNQVPPILDRAPEARPTTQPDAPVDALNVAIIVAVPMAVLAASLLVALWATGRPDAPKVYPQSEW